MEDVYKTSLLLFLFLNTILISPGMALLLVSLSLALLLGVAVGLVCSADVDPTFGLDPFLVVLHLDVLLTLLVPNYRPLPTLQLALIISSQVQHRAAVTGRILLKVEYLYWIEGYYISMGGFH